MSAESSPHEPIAFDAGELLGAVAFATWDPYPGDFEPEWWCAVELFVRYGDSWRSCGGEPILAIRDNAPLPPDGASSSDVTSSFALRASRVPVGRLAGDDCAGRRPTDRSGV